MSASPSPGITTMGIVHDGYGQRHSILAQFGRNRGPHLRPWVKLSRLDRGAILSAMAEAKSTALASQAGRSTEDILRQFETLLQGSQSIPQHPHLPPPSPDP